MAKSQNLTGCSWLFAMLIGIVVLGQCSSKSDVTSPTTSETVAPLSLSETNSEMEASAPSFAPPSGASTEFIDGETVYVTAASLNGRSNPSTEGSIVSKIPQGTPVEIIGRSGNWMRVRAPKGDAWISSDHVSRSRPASRARYTPPQRFYGDNCPCSGRNVCIGPRGGRYCITSGGNKRYGV